MASQGCVVHKCLKEYYEVLELAFISLKKSKSYQVLIKKNKNPLDFFQVKYLKIKIRPNTNAMISDNLIQNRKEIFHNNLSFVIR